MERTDSPTQSPSDSPASGSSSGSNESDNQLDLSDQHLQDNSFTHGIKQVMKNKYFLLLCGALTGIFYIVTGI